jgi:hypothetical protein
MDKTPGNITFEPLGNGRDVYWCHIINEPGFVTFKEEPGKTQQIGCSICGWLCDDVNIDGLFLTEHTFVCHISKPLRKLKGAGDG